MQLHESIHFFIVTSFCRNSDFLNLFLEMDLFLTRSKSLQNMTEGLSPISLLTTHLNFVGEV